VNFKFVQSESTCAWGRPGVSPGRLTGRQWQLSAASRPGWRLARPGGPGSGGPTSSTVACPIRAWRRIRVAESSLARASYALHVEGVLILLLCLGCETGPLRFTATRTISESIAWRHYDPNKINRRWKGCYALAGTRAP
jgi:hypothetical protein